jgi:hypothetical protein
LYVELAGARILKSDDVWTKFVQYESKKKYRGDTITERSQHFGINGTKPEKSIIENMKDHNVRFV